MLTVALPLASCSRIGIPAGDAKDHIGEQTTVYGRVYSSKLTKSGTVLLDIGGAYPNEEFSVVEFDGDTNFPELVKLEGKIISVTGTIKDFRGKPEIVISSPRDISN
jgi:DNA/RNA endonuclease YhcR with UshA esterase domain